MAANDNDDGMKAYELNPEVFSKIGKNPGDQGSAFLRDFILGLLREATDPDGRQAVLAVIRKSGILNQVSVEHAADIVIAIKDACKDDAWFSQTMADMEAYDKWVANSGGALN